MIQSSGRFQDRAAQNEMSQDQETARTDNERNKIGQGNGIRSQENRQSIDRGNAGALRYRSDDGGRLEFRLF